MLTVTRIANLLIANFQFLEKRFQQWGLFFIAKIISAIGNWQLEINL